MLTSASTVLNVITIFCYCAVKLTFWKCRPLTFVFFKDFSIIFCSPKISRKFWHNFNIYLVHKLKTYPTTHMPSTENSRFDATVSKSVALFKEGTIKSSLDLQLWLTDYWIVGAASYWLDLGKGFNSLRFLPFMLIASAQAIMPTSRIHNSRTLIAYLFMLCSCPPI